MVCAIRERNSRPSADAETKIGGSVAVVPGKGKVLILTDAGVVIAAGRNLSVGMDDYRRDRATVAEIRYGLPGGTERGIHRSIGHQSGYGKVDILSRTVGACDHDPSIRLKRHIAEAALLNQHLAVTIKRGIK